MLLRFRFSNFRSFRDEAELSLVASGLDDSPNAAFAVPGLKERVLPVAAIYGANASGKTNVVRALQFMSEAVRDSHRSWAPDDPIPRHPFASGAAATAASLFEADFVLDNVRHRYGFILDSASIIEEWLLVYPSGKPQAWFKRKRGEPISFGSKLPGENRAIEALTRPNSLFLSAAAQNNHVALSPPYLWFSNSLSFVLDRTTLLSETTRLCSDESYRKAIAGLVSGADLGIEGLRLQERQASIAVDIVGVERRPPFAFKLPEIRLAHRFGPDVIPFDQELESGGTLAYLALLGPVVWILRDGGTVCVDELDASLHPLLAVRIIELFNDPARNPHRAQLIFNTQDTNLLSSKVLRRDEIWFTEKQPDGNSKLYPLTDFKPRRHENLENGYLQGRYGAIPFINAGSFVDAFGDDGAASS
ncbi:MAG: AAA family ATPase [Bryobacteraceae bacterium]|jgi:hypothetical protein